MPKYFVRLAPDGLLSEDSEDLPNDEAAERLVEGIVSDLQRGKLSGPYQGLVIINEQGEIVCERPLVVH